MKRKKCSAGALVEWIAGNSKNRPRKMTMIYLFKFEVDPAAFFISTPPFIPAASSDFVRSPALSAQGAFSAKNTTRINRFIRLN